MKTSGRSDLEASASDPLPFLATPDQIDAEESLVQFLAVDDPELRRIQTALRAELAATPRGRTKDGEAKLDHAIEMWTSSLVLNEITAKAPSPVILWVAEDGPRTWLGHTLSGLGISGNNPDAIFRQTFLDGSGQYELVGRFDQSNRGVQFIIEGFQGDRTYSKSLSMAENGTRPIMLTDRDLEISPDGAFRLTLGGDAGGSPNDVAMQPGPISLLFRDIFSDWSQQACRLAIRRLDRKPAEPSDPADLRRFMHEDLGGYVRFWSAFPDTFNALKPNTVAQPREREKGWGFISPLAFKLAGDEALLVTISSGNAAYTGFQVIDPWMVGEDARSHQVSLNISQAKPNKNGTYTYVVSATDPGVANWLDTVGLEEGFGFIRWAALPSGTTGDGLVRDCRVVHLAELENIPGLGRISAEQRKAQLADRETSYNKRLL